MQHFTLASMLSLFFLPALGQQVLFTEDFEGTQHGFTLNTADLGSVQGAGGDNFWAVNNAYAGGSGTMDCFGIPIPITIPATAAQPQASHRPMAITCTSAARQAREAA